MRKRYLLHWGNDRKSPELKWQIWDWSLRVPVVHLENRALGRQICKLLNDSKPLKCLAIALDHSTSRANHVDFFPLTGKPTCPTCGQPEGVKLDVGASGFSVTTGFEHLAECPALRCPHGTPWQEDCPICEADRDGEEYDDT